MAELLPSEALGAGAGHHIAASPVEEDRRAMWAAPSAQRQRPVSLLAQNRATTAGTGRSSIVVGRCQGTVVVTVHGELDLPKAAHLGATLADLIDGQGNLSVVVDLHDATGSDPDCLSVLVEAAERARRRGGRIELNEPPGSLRSALQLRGLEEFVACSPATAATEDGSP